MRKGLAVTVCVVYMSNRIFESSLSLFYIFVSRAGRVPRGEMSAFVNVVMVRRRPRLVYMSKCTFKCLISGIFDHGSRRKRLPATGNAIVMDLIADK